MARNDYIFVLGIFGVAWAIFFLWYGQMWHLPIAFVPLAIGAFFYYGFTSEAWFVSFPILSLFLIDLHLIVSKPKFNGWVRTASYLLVLPFLVVYLYYLKDSIKNESLLSSIFNFFIYFLVITVISKIWISNILLLVINRLYLLSKTEREMQVTYRCIKGGRFKTYHAVITNMGEVEISGFLYLYLDYKNIKSNDRLLFQIKNGCLGIEYISGFPKILSRGSS